MDERIMTSTTTTTAEPPAFARAGWRRAAAMAAVAAILAIGGVLGLEPRAAEATPRSLPSATGRPATDAASDQADDDADTPDPPPARGGKRVSGRLNLNTATTEQLMLLPGVGPAKAERVVAWRKRNGTFRRVADLRRVKGFGYRTVKRLEPWLDIKGETTLRPGGG